MLEDKNFDDSLKYFQMGKIVAKKNDELIWPSEGEYTRLNLKNN